MKRNQLFHNLSIDFIMDVFSLARGVGNEICHYRGFVRFMELENQILFSKIEPKNQILPFLMVHFADRMAW